MTCRTGGAASVSKLGRSTALGPGGAGTGGSSRSRSSAYGWSSSPGRARGTISQLSTGPVFGFWVIGRTSASRCRRWPQTSPLAGRPPSPPTRSPPAAPTDSLSLPVPCSNLPTRQRGVYVSAKTTGACHDCDDDGASRANPQFHRACYAARRVRVRPAWLADSRTQGRSVVGAACPDQ